MDQSTEKMVAKLTDSLCDIVKGFEKHVSEGLGEYNTEEAGKTADIIKDLATAIEKLNESSYYCSVNEAMDKGVKVQQFKPMVDQRPFNNMYLGINRPNDPSFDQEMYSGYDEPRRMQMGFDTTPDMPRRDWRPRMAYDPSMPPNWDPDWHDRRPADRPDIHIADPNKI